MLRFALPTVAAAVVLLVGPAQASVNAWHGPHDLGWADVWALAFAPSNPRIVYAGVYGGGVYESTNGGRTWQSSAGLGDHLLIGALAVDPKNAATVYAGADLDGLFKSTNGGRTWRASGLAGVERFYGLAIDPHQPATIYAATEYGVSKSTNGGRSWRLITRRGGLALALDPTDANVVYSAGSKVHKSVNGGATWRAATAGLPRLHTVVAFAIDPKRPSTLYVVDGSYPFVFKSIDGGSTWRSSGAGLPRGSASSIAIDPRNPRILYVCTEGGVYKTTDGARKWRLVRKDEFASPDHPYNTIAIDPKNSRDVYVGTVEGLLKTTNAGRSWGWGATRSLAGLAVDLLVGDPVAPATVYAAGDTGEGLFKSTNGGVNWASADKGLDDGSGLYVRALAIDPTTRTTLYVRFDSQGIVKSTDGGASWRVAGRDTPHALALAVDPQQPATVYAATSHGVYKSVDAGRTWRRAGLAKHDLRYLAFDSQDPSMLYAGGSGVFKTANGGDDWDVVNSRTPEDTSELLAIDTRDPTTVYALTTDGRGYRSVNGGRWNVFGRGLNDLEVTSLVLTANGKTLYAGTDLGQRGVFTIPASGGTWRPFNRGLTNLDVGALAINANGKVLYAGTEGGVFDRKLP